MAPKFTYNPDKDIPDLAGKVFFITGGTAGVGKEALLAFVKHNPARIFFTGRSEKNGSAVVEEAKNINADVQVTHIKCDQESLASVNTAADQFLAASDRLDSLICNAGVMAVPAGTTQDGYEKHMGINHMAHALLIRRLLPALERTAKDHDVRLIALSSLAFNLAPPGGILFDDLKTEQNMAIMGRFYRYGQSKLANVIYANELARRYPDLMVVSLHPGVIHGSELQSHLPMLDRVFIRVTTIGQSIGLAEGAYNTEWAATTDRKNITSGDIYQPVGTPLAQNKYSKDEKMRDKLWEWTQKELDAFEQQQVAAA